MWGLSHGSAMLQGFGVSVLTLMLSLPITCEPSTDPKILMVAPVMLSKAYNAHRQLTLLNG